MGMVMSIRNAKKFAYTRTVFHDGEWIEPVPRNFYLQCCDCGLIHRANFRIVNGQIQFQLFRLKRRKKKR